MFDETEVRERLAKKMKRFNTTTSVIDAGLTTSTLITRGVFIAAFTNSAFDIALSGASLIFFLLRQ